MGGKNAMDRTFGLTGPKDLLDKLEWEAGLLYLAVNDNSSWKAPVYHALNAATTAWHILDWVCDDLDERDAWGMAAVAINASDRRDLIASAKNHRSLAACWQVANAWKHRSLDRSYQHGYTTSSDFLFFEQDGKFGAVRRIAIQMPGADFDVCVVMNEVIDWWTAKLGALGYLR